MELVLHTALHTLIDTAKMLPFLFGVYLLIEYLEHKASEKMEKAVAKLGAFGPVGGAVLGCIPQCGFSVAVSNLYAGRLVSVGTLLAVFIATSDEAIPILLANPQKAGDILKLISAKIIIALLFGFIANLLVKLLKKWGKFKDEPNDLCENCGCEEKGILHSAIIHTLQIFAFLFVVSFVFGLVIELLGEDTINSLLMSGSVFQPFLSALIGLVPNCAPSVILTELYISGSLSFGSVIAGLSTGAGLGLVVLYKTNKNLKQNIIITASLYLAGALSGMVIDFIM